MAILMLSWPASAHAAKTDSLTLRNRDHITGEVKGLSRGKLDYSTDDAGRLSIEWVKVARVQSPHSFEVEVASGRKFFGRLSPAARDGAVVVEGMQIDTLSIPSVVRISTLEAEFLQRMRAYLDMGFTFAKANRATTFTTSGEASYRGPKFGTTIGFDSYAQGQETVPTTTRNDADLFVTRYLPKRWSAIMLGQVSQNDELDLEYRVTAAAVMGRIVAQSNSAEIGAGAGLAVARERFSSPQPGVPAESNTNLEGLLVGQWNAFRFDSPKLDYSAELYLYPSLSTPGRVRGDLSLRLKYELFSDFNVGVNLTDTFDSEPPEEGATKNDFIVTFTIGWSYRR